MAAVCVLSLADRSVVARGQPPARSNAEIRSLIDGAHYQDAEDAARSLFAAVVVRTGSGSLESAKASDVLVEALLRNGRGALRSTRDLAEAAFHTKEAQLRPDDIELSASVRNLANVLLDSGDVRASLVHFERALSLQEKVNGPQHLATADALNDLGRALLLSDRYDDAKRSLERAQAIEVQGRSSDQRLATTLEQLTTWHHRKGDILGARPLIERALRIREDSGRIDSDLIGALNLFGVQLWFEGEPRAERSFYDRALEIGRRILRADHPLIGVIFKNQAIPAVTLGDLSEARELQLRALAIAEANFGATHPEVAEYLNDLANTGVKQGDYLGARRLYERATRIVEDRLGPDDLTLATYRYNLAIIDGRLADLVEARRDFGRATRIWQRVFGQDHPIVARAHNALGEVLIDHGLYGEAQSLFERALTIRERSLGPNHGDVARTLARLATVMERRGQPEKARELSARAVAIVERSDTPEAPSFATILSTHAGLQAARGDYQSARQLFERVLAIRERVVGRAHPDYARAEAGLAAALAGLGDSKSALTAALDAEDTGRQHLRLIVRNLAERQSLGYYSNRPRGLDLALSVLVSDGRADVRAFDSLIRSRALVLDEMAERRRVADASHPEVAALWSALASARQRLATLVVRGPSDNQSQQYAKLVEDARRQKESAERALAESSAEFRDELARGEIGANDVQAALPPHSALIAFAKYDRTLLSAATTTTSRMSTAKRLKSARQTVPSYVAFLIRAGHSEISIVPIGSTDAIDRLVAQWRYEVASGDAPESPEKSEAGKDSRATGSALRQRIWDPFASTLQGVQTLFIVPDGALSLASWAALPVGKTLYLIERGPVIHYLSAERDLVTTRTAASSGNGLLAVGGPAFDDKKGIPATTPALSTSTPAGRLRDVPSSCVSLQNVQFSALPASLDEAREVAGVWKASDGSRARASEMLFGQSATEKMFKEQAPGHRVLHLATHGFFLGDTCQPTIAGTRAVGGLTARKASQVETTSVDSPLLLSGLAFAGANRRSASRANDDDGILTAEEVASLNLEGVEWAVLSACDTGLGQIKAGEGVFGLRRAFQIAGARTVIMSLWSVDDEASRLWMRALYQGRLQKHLSTADAVQQASLSILRARRARGESTHPFYWAGFVAAGDWR